MIILRMIIAIVGILCIFLGLLTPLSLILFVGVGLVLVSIGVVMPLIFSSEREKSH